jgi:hypothetical protein
MVWQGASARLPKADGWGRRRVDPAPEDEATTTLAEITAQAAGS